jgi:hypothetical protein
MSTLRDDLIELGARALCKKRGYDPDRKMPKTVQQPFRRCEVGEPLWKEHTDDAALILDVMLARIQRQKSSQGVASDGESRGRIPDSGAP